MIASIPVALIPFLQNRCVAALSSLPRADSSSPAAACTVAAFFFASDLPVLPMGPVNPTAGKSSSPLSFCAQNNRGERATAFALSKSRPTNSSAGEANHRERFVFCFSCCLAHFVQETDRSVSSPLGRKRDDRGRSENCTHRLPRPHRQKRTRAADRQREGQSQGHQDLEMQD